MDILEGNQDDYVQSCCSFRIALDLAGAEGHREKFMSAGGKLVPTRHSERRSYHRNDLTQSSGRYKNEISKFMMQRAIETYNNSKFGFIYSGRPLYLSRARRGTLSVRNYVKLLIAQSMLRAM